VTKIQNGLEALKHKPILICWGDQDFVFDLDFLNEWQRFFPDAQIKRFPQAGHYVLEDTFDQIEPIVSEFMNKRKKEL